MTTLQYRSKPRITELAFCAWLGHAKPGDTLEYHRGYLVMDISPQSAGFSDKDRKELAHVARRARWAAERNLVHLFQRRCAPNVFSYLAIARPHPKTIPASLSSLLLSEVA